MSLRPLLLAGTMLFAGTALAAPSFAQTAPVAPQGGAGHRTRRRRRARRHRRHRAEAVGAAAGRAARGVGGQRRHAREPGPRQPRGRAVSRPDAQLPEERHDAQPVAVPARRRHGDLLDRRRAVGVDRPRRRRLQPLGGGVQRPRRHRAHRGPARAAGDAVRQERERRRHQHRLEEARRQARRLGRGGLLRRQRQRVPRARRDRPAAVGAPAQPLDRLLRQV